MLKYRDLLPHSGPSHELIPAQIWTQGGWHRDASQAVMSVATVISSMAIQSLRNARTFRLRLECRETTYTLQF